MGSVDVRVILAMICAITVYVQAETRTHYVGAVVEYHRFWDSKLDSRANLLRNVENYTKIMALGQNQGIDIIVFPEVGLQAAYKPELVPVPDVSANVTPRLDKSQHKALRMLSKGAYENKMYVVVNLKEISDSNDTSYVYNTNVAFDRNGTIVGRYRKFHPFGENVTKPDAPDHSFFDTDFGVRFGMFTCFDILFEEPAQVLVQNYNVTDVAFPTAWYSQLPFLTATQYQASWSYGTGVNLLASGLNHVEGGSTGSGIYGGFEGPIEYILSERNGCKLIYKRIPIKGHVQEDVNGKPSEISECSLRPEGKLHMLKEKLDFYTTELMSPPYTSGITVKTITSEKTKIKMYSVDENICQGDFCCSFSLEVQLTFVPEVKDVNVKGDDFQYFRYRFAVLDGVRDFEGQDTGGLQVCGIISCLDENLDTCAVRADSRIVLPLSVFDEDFGILQLKETLFKEIWIHGTFKKSHSFISPNILMKSDKIGQYGMLPDYKSFNFTKVDDGDRVHAGLMLNNNNRGNVSLVTAAIYSRVYDRDGRSPGVNYSPTFAVFSSSLAVVAVSLWLCKMFLFKD